MGMLNGSERECPICGKVFWATAEHAYKAMSQGKQYIFCRYNCMRAFEKGDKKPKGKNIGKRICGLKEKVYQMLDDGLTMSEIIRMTGQSYSAIKYHKDKWEEKKWIEEHGPHRDDE
jgi:YHS domain-containing protein